MATAIGSLTGFNAWRGIYQAPLAPAQLVVRAGVGSTGLILGTARGIPVDVNTWIWGTLAACQAHEAAAVALHGTVASCTDALGYTCAHTTILLHPAPPSGRITRADGLGGTATHICHCTWTHVPEA